MGVVDTAGAAVAEASAPVDAPPPQPGARKQTTAMVTSNAAIHMVDRTTLFGIAILTHTGIGSLRTRPEVARSCSRRYAHRP